MDTLDNIKVNCQTDKKYSDISSNQCSWCAAEFIKHSSKLKYLYLSRQLEEFDNLYNQCLLNGSYNRLKHNHRLYGENIDNKQLLSVTDICKIKNYTILANTDNIFLKILPKDLREEFYKNIYTEVNQNFFSDKTIGNYLVSRHGQSFTVITLYPFNKVLVLDSHIHFAKIMSIDEINSYIFNVNCGHTHVTLIQAA